MKATKYYAENCKLLVQLSKDQLLELNRIELDAIANFHGDIHELESALGFLRIGHHTGWKYLVLVHNKRTIRKYEEILGINIREFFVDEGPSAERSAAYKYIKKLGNFWKAVSGDVKVEEKNILK